MSLRINPSPVESPQARKAIVGMYRALLILEDNGVLEEVEALLPDVVGKARDAVIAAEAGMSPNLLCTVLPTYTKVRFQTDRSRDGEFIEGQMRDGAWGLFPEVPNAGERRITTTSGFEFFVTPETVFTNFEVIERPGR